MEVESVRDAGILCHELCVVGRVLRAQKMREQFKTQNASSLFIRRRSSVRKKGGDDRVSVDCNLLCEQCAISLFGVLQESDETMYSYLNTFEMIGSRIVWASYNITCP